MKKRPRTAHLKKVNSNLFLIIIHPQTCVTNFVSLKFTIKFKPDIQTTKRQKIERQNSFTTTCADNTHILTSFLIYGQTLAKNDEDDNSVFQDFQCRLHFCFVPPILDLLLGHF